MSTEVVTKDMGHVDIPTLKQFAISNQETIDTAVTRDYASIDAKDTLLLSISV